MSTTTTRDLASPAPAKATPVKPRRGLRGSRTFNFWLFIGPFLVGLMLFVYVPIGWSIYLSFFDARFTVTPSKFIGFDNIPEGAMHRPALTSVAIGAREIGEESARLLLRRIKSPDGSPESIILPPKLVIRESCCSRSPM